MPFPMNTAVSTPSAPRRRVWPWVLAFVLAPFVIVAVGIASYVTLDRDASVLRRQVMAATNTEWTTKMQVSVGGGTITTVRAGLSFVENADMEDVRGALRAVKSASVGVYERASDDVEWSAQALLVDTDRVMSQRGWTRLVGVAGRNETVMVYVPAKFDAAGPIDVALAVIDGRELVVASATIDPEALTEVVERHAAGRFGGRLRELARR